MFSKKAQISETMTWIVATIIIIIALSVSLLFVRTDFFIGAKKLGVSGEGDILITKSFIGYLSTKENGNTIYEEIAALNNEKRMGDEVVVNPDLAKKIFKETYSKYYDNSWLGFVFVQGVLPSGTVVQDFFPNIYFGKKEGKAALAKSSLYSYDELWLDKEGKIAVELIKYHKE